MSNQYLFDIISFKLCYNNNKHPLLCFNSKITFISLHWALDPILLTLNAESIERRQESKNNFLLVYNCLSVIDIMLVAVYSVISLAIVQPVGLIFDLVK